MVKPQKTQIPSPCGLHGGQFKLRNSKQSKWCKYHWFVQLFGTYHLTRRIVQRSVQQQMHYTDYVPSANNGNETPNSWYIMWTSKERIDRPTFTYFPRELLYDILSTVHSLLCRILHQMSSICWPKPVVEFDFFVFSNFYSPTHLVRNATTNSANLACFAWNTILDMNQSQLKDGGYPLLSVPD